MFVSFSEKERNAKLIVEMAGPQTSLIDPENTSMSTSVIQFYHIIDLYFAKSKPNQYTVYLA